MSAQVPTILDKILDRKREEIAERRALVSQAELEQRCKALEPCRCRVVQGSELRQFLADHPDFALHLTRKLMRMVRRLTEQVRSVALQDVYGRMVRVLTELSEPMGEERLLRQKLTQQDIADRIGASREMVNRIMKELTTGGYVGQRDGRLVILRKLPAAW